MNDYAMTAEMDAPDDRVVWLHGGYRHKELCKQLPGAKWDNDRKLWHAPLSWATCQQLRGIFGDQLQVGPNLVAWATGEVERRIAPCIAIRNLSGIAGELDAPGDPALYGFQRWGVEFLTKAKRAILADEMGTGKTVQLAVTLRTLREQGLNPFPCLVIAPNSVKTVWRRELKAWCPDATIGIVSGSAAARRKVIAERPDVLIVNYEMAWRMSRLSGYGNLKLTDAEKEEKDLNVVPWSTVICDEAHRLKNPKAKQTRACWYLAHQPSVAYRYGLTGTPLANAPDDLWAILHMISPEEWPARTRYVDRYCLQSWNPFGGMDVVGVRPETRDELFRIVDPRMRRMPKALVLPFLPPKVRSVRESEMTTKQAKAYEQMRTTMIATLDEKLNPDGEEGRGWTGATLPIVQNMRLMQFSSSYAYVDSEDNVKLDFPSNKVDALVELLDEMPDDEPLVVFAESRQLIEMAGRKLEEMRVRHGFVVGGQTPDERERATTDFQEGRTRVILCTIKAGGEGITLTRARHCVFLQRSWSMIGNKQAEDRVHRIGSEQHDTVHIIDVMAPGTIEEQQVEALHLKLQRLQEIVRDMQIIEAAAAAGNADAQAKLLALAEEQAAIENDDDIARSIIKQEGSAA